MANPKGLLQRAKVMDMAEAEVTPVRLMNKVVQVSTITFKLEPIYICNLGVEVRFDASFGYWASPLNCLEFDTHFLGLAGGDLNFDFFWANMI